MSSMFFYALAIVLLLVPTSLVAAELATGWPQTGGVYAWAREAFGERIGFMTVWLQWSSVVISMPAIMSVVTVNAAYIFDPDLGTNRWFVFAVIVVVMWCMTAVAAWGVRESAWMTNAAVVVGIVVPGLVLAVLGLLYVLQGRPNQMTGAGRELVPSSVTCTRSSSRARPSSSSPASSSRLPTPATSLVRAATTHGRSCWRP